VVNAKRKHFFPDGINLLKQFPKLWVSPLTLAAWVKSKPLGSGHPAVAVLGVQSLLVLPRFVAQNTRIDIGSAQLIHPSLGSLSDPNLDHAHGIVVGNHI